MDGAYSPGDHVVTRKLAADLGVSATPAREAMLRLVQESALEMLNARTVVVPRLTAQRLSELHYLRDALEPLLAEHGARNLKDEDIRRLARSNDRMAAAYDRQDFHAVFRENRDFHFLIYRAAAMPLIVSVVQTVWLRIGPTYRLLYPTLAVPEDALRIHAAAIAAARNRDGAALAAAIRDDLHRGHSLLTKVIRN